MTLRERKNQLRAEARAKRGAVHNAQDLPVIAAAAQARLAELLANYPGQIISGYWPIGSELDPGPAMVKAHDHSPICLPVTHGRDVALSFRLWSPGCAMASAGFGTQAPADGEEVAPQVLVLPMLGFDRAGNRLGYGAGHYDRSLDGLRAKGPRIVIGYAFAAQEFPQLPAEATDQPLDLIVTDRELIRPSA